MIGRRLPKNRRFFYEPHYYDPKKDEISGKKIKFKRSLSRRSSKTRSIVWLFMLLALIIYIIYFLSKLGNG